MIKLLLFIGVAAVTFSPVAVWAETLPKGATKLTEQEVRSMYEGQSSDWKSTRAFFSADGSVVLVRKDKSLYGEGRWAVNGNKMCMTINWTRTETGKRGSTDDCYTWHRSGKRYLTRWSGDQNKADGYSDDEPSRLSAGDKVSQQISELKSN